MARQKNLRIALAALRQPASLDAGVGKVLGVLDRCGRRGVDIVCFPETYLPGLRGIGLDLPAPNQPAMRRALARLRVGCRQAGVAAIVGYEWVAANGLQNRAIVIDASGRVLGYQSKNQITPGGESDCYVPDGRRRVFKVKGVTFGIAICHEGWRYPEAVRWAAVRGAKIVFHPQVTGGDTGRGSPVTGRSYRWGDSFYEKAMQCRAGENGLYFASVNMAMKFQNSATSLIAPNGGRIASLPPGREGLLIHDIDPATATRLYARRFQPKLFPTARG